MKRIFLVFVFAIAVRQVWSQTDTSNLEISRLGINDIRYEKKDSVVPLINTTLRGPLALSQSPFENYIITQDEILHFGCNTLTDVLRLIPGIMVSKIGSAEEGELFTVNGLRGNGHFQILINEVPLRNFSTKGMSLGAQLPIKQAERIEIQLGSAATAYGFQAGGGVINIVLKESERPVYTSAELNFGLRNYNNIDVNFGGKVGKGKYVARYNFYGGYTIMNNRLVNGDSSIFLPQTYDPSRSYLNNQNGKDWSNLERPFSKADYELPHLSRYAGFHFNYRAFFISYDQISRKDHISMGLNPSVLRYKDQSSYFEDDMRSISVGFNSNNKNYNFRILGGALTYRISDGSSAYYYSPQAALFLDSIKGSDIPQSSKLFYENNRKRLSDRQKYISGTELSFPFQVNFDRKLIKNLFIGLGTINQLVIYDPLSKYGLNLKNRTTDTLDFGFSSSGNLSFAGLMMAKLYYKSENTFALIDMNSGFMTVRSKISPYNNIRFGLQQKIKAGDRNLMLKINFNRSQLPISPFLLESEFYTYAAWKTPSNSIQRFDKRNFNPNAKPQEMKDFQIAVQKFSSRSQQSLQYQYHTINGLASYHFFEEYNKAPAGADAISAPNIRAFTSGFDFNSGNYATVNQFKYALAFNLDQMNFVNNLWRRSIINVKYGFTYQWGKEKINNINYNYVRLLPKRISQLGMYFNLFSNLSIGMVWNYYSSFYTSLSYRDINPQPANASHQIDFIFDYALSDNLKLKVKINNAFNKTIFGIDATETPDDLKFNMQQSRFSQIGIAYNLDYKPKKPEIKKSISPNDKAIKSNEFKFEFGN